MALDQSDKRFITKLLNEGFAQQEKRINKRFDEVDKRFGEVDKRFDEVDKRFGEVDKRFARQEKRIDDRTSEDRIRSIVENVVIDAINDVMIPAMDNMASDLRNELASKKELKAVQDSVDDVKSETRFIRQDIRDLEADLAANYVSKKEFNKPLVLQQ